MKTLITIGLFLLGASGLGVKPTSQQNTAKTDIPDAGPCTNFPARYERLEERLAWFYGCMHENPPTVEEIRAKIAALPPDKRSALKPYDFPTQEALIGTANVDLPMQVFPVHVK
jgi:hypothetical protein